MSYLSINYSVIQGGSNCPFSANKMLAIKVGVFSESEPVFRA